MVAASTVAVVAGLGLLPAAAALVGATAAEKIRLSPKRLSASIHFAAGGILAVVALELLPESQAILPTWGVIAWFLAGGAFFIAFDWATDFVRGLVGAPEENAGPWVLFTGLAVDLVTDGLMVGAAYLLSPDLGLLLAVGLVLVAGPEGFVSVASFRHAGVPRGRRLLLMGVLAAAVVASTVAGYVLLAPRPDSWRVAVLAFTAGVLVTLVVEEMAPHAHEAAAEDRRMTAAFLVGFSAFAVIGAYLG